MIQRSYVIPPSNDNGKKSKVKNTRAVFEEKRKGGEVHGLLFERKKKQGNIWDVKESGPSN